MSAHNRWLLRIGVLTDLVERSRTRLGRTALMKLAYFLQTVKGVPLGYNFRVYTYGPFDEDVLNDIGQAESMQAITSAMIPFNNASGYGYEFSSGPAAVQVRTLVAERINPYKDDIEWVIEKFGSRIASDLELLSTIVYAARDRLDRTVAISFDELAKQVQDIKPRFSIESVRERIQLLADMGLLSSDKGHSTSPSNSSSVLSSQ
jgi:uncharacterized protein